MSRQSQWLFETPLDQTSRYYADFEYETSLENEWEMSAFPADSLELTEDEWEALASKRRVNRTGRIPKRTSRQATPSQRRVQPSQPQAELTRLQSERFRHDQRLQAAANNRPPMRFGERGEAVKKLQQALLDLKFPMPISTRRQGVPDGIYGRETAATVRKFQAKYGLKIDGVAGQHTLTRLDQLFRRPGKLPGHTTIPERWLPVLGGNGKIRSGNQVTSLIDGPATFAAMAAVIRTATNQQHYIYLLGWWLDDDVPLIPSDPTSTIRSLFARAASQGVQIRAMLWDQKLPPTKNTAEVNRIDALATGAAILDDNTLPTGSHHQKVLVVKGENGLASFCGGVDINKDRVVSVASSSSSGGQGSPLHDVHCKIQGPAAHDLLRVFIQRWEAHPEHLKKDAAKGALLGLKEPVPAAKGNKFVRIARTFNLVTPTRCVKDRSIRTVMVNAIRAARQFIYIEDQYLISMEAAAELRKALPNIQHLTIVIPHSCISDLPQVWERRKAFLDFLLRGPDAHKVRVFFLATPGTRHLPRTCKGFGPLTYIHAKTWVIDDELAIIGSANCNQRGWSHDSEVIAAVFDILPSSTSVSFAQNLRIQLWAKHLNVNPSLVHDGVKSAALWLSPPVGAWIRPYDRNEDTDSLKKKENLMPLKFVDPSGDTYPPCPGGIDTEARVLAETVLEFETLQT